EVLSLKGAWGVGKTYAWNKLVSDNKKNIALPRYCYVSLFGMNSIADLRLAIYAKTRNVAEADAELTDESTLRAWKSKAEALGKWAMERVLPLREVPLLKHLSLGFEAFASYLI